MQSFAFVLAVGVACGGKSTRVTLEDDVDTGAGRGGATAATGGATGGLGAYGGSGGVSPSRGGSGGSVGTSGRSGAVGGGAGRGAAGSGAAGRASAGNGGSSGGIATDAGEGGMAGEAGGAALASDIQHTELSIDLDLHEGTATLTLGASTAPSLSFETGDLEILSVTGEDGALPFDTSKPGRLEVLVHAMSGRRTLTIQYRFHDHEHLDGYSAQGYTFTWPYFCGNLFPCHSDPADGMAFELNVRGGMGTFVYPRSIPNEAPPYMLAWVQGNYTEVALGTTGAGTEVSVFYRPDVDVLTNVLGGVSPLRASLDWLETTLGPYAFGSKVASVSVPWTGGGMEHHPYFHVASDHMGTPLTHVHEAAHGWFGNGVRLRCWEDIVLSEGTASYLAARALEGAGQKTTAAAAWQAYQSAAFATDTPWTSSWPTTCGERDVLHAGYYSPRMYARGALFYRALENKVGRTALDRALGAFYQAWVGKAATFQDLLTTVADRTGYDPLPCAVKWLRNDETPGDTCE